MTLYVGSKKIAQKIGVASTGVKLPDQTDNAGKFLSTDGTVLAWTNPTEQVEQDIASINEKLIKKTHVTNCITEIPQDIKLEIVKEKVEGNWYAWVNYIIGVVLYSKSETVVNGDELYTRNAYGEYNVARTIGTDVNIIDETTLEDVLNFSYNLVRDSEYDRTSEEYESIVLKAGSKVYFPNGLQEEKLSYSLKSNNTDLSFKNNSKNAGRYYIFVNENGIYFENIGSVSVGDEFPTENVYEGVIFYNLTTNKVYKYNGTEWEEIILSLPLGIIIISDYKIYDIDEVFNGFGYMGNMVYVLPGVKSFLPAGKNEDGSYNSIEYTQETIAFAVRDWKPSTNEYLIYGEGYLWFEEYYYTQSTRPVNGSIYAVWYNPDTNYMSYYNGLKEDWYQYSEICIASNISSNSEAVTDWNIKKVIKLADQNEVNDRIEEVANELETVLDTKLDNKIEEVNTEINEVRDYAENVQENVEAVDSKLEEFKQTIKVVNSLPVNPETGVLYFVRA